MWWNRWRTKWPAVRAWTALIITMQTAEEYTDDATVWLYVGYGPPEPGTVRLGDLRALVRAFEEMK